MIGHTKRAVVLSVLLAAGAASGQDAHGDGRVKDANQRVGSGGYNSAVRADFSAANALRAAIVTGNAPGGLSFRGDVGYAAPREFRGELGSDDLFEFRRDSLYSGLSGQGIRGTDALQYQFALTTGSRPPAALAGSLTVQRDATGVQVPVDPARPATDAAAGAVSTLTRVDPASFGDTRGAGSWRLRSSAGYVTDRSLAESLVGGYETEAGDRFGVSASPLGGIRSFEVSPQSQRSRDTLAMPSDASSPAAQPMTADTAAQTTSLSAYDRLVEGVQGEYGLQRGLNTGGEGGVVEMVEEQNRKLREFLESVRSDATPEPIQQDEPSGEEPGEPIDPDEPVPASERLIRELDELGVERGAIEALRSTQTRIDDLVDPGRFAGQDFYATHMTNGRELMAAGRYFEAEARFSLALSVREGDPTASIARVHAQIGAGLFLSASVNLRDTFTQNPLLIAATYAPELMPTDARLRSVIERLNARVDGEGSEARAAALLLAYVGRHADDQNLVRRGLSRLDVDGPDRLAQLLRLVWLDDADVQRALDQLGEASEDGAE